MAPFWVLKLDRHAFSDARAACQGRQVAAVVAAIEAAMPGLIWYAADVQCLGSSFLPRRDPIPARVGDGATMIRAAELVDQFESGVFVGIRPGRTNPGFRDGGLWTEDDELADLGDSVVEIRAFDMTYISVASRDEVLRRKLEETDFTTAS